MKGSIVASWPNSLHYPFQTLLKFYVINKALIKDLEPFNEGQIVDHGLMLDDRSMIMIHAH